jgi:hypothetical protein
MYSFTKLMILRPEIRVEIAHFFIFLCSVPRVDTEWMSISGKFIDADLFQLTKI